MKNTVGHTGSIMQLLQIYVVTHSYRMSSSHVNILRRLGFFLLMLKYFRPEKRSTWLWQCFMSISCLNDTRRFKQTYCVIGQATCSVRICQVCLIFIVQSLQCGRVADLTGLVVFSSIRQVSFFHACSSLAHYVLSRKDGKLSLSSALLFLSGAVSELRNRYIWYFWLNHSLKSQVISNVQSNSN